MRALHNPITLLLLSQIPATFSLATPAQSSNQTTTTNPGIGTPLIPSSRSRVQVHPNTGKKPVRMQAGLTVHLLLTTMAKSWAITAPYPLYPDSRVRDDFFPQEADFHLDNPTAEFTTQVAAWASSDMLDSLFQSARGGKQEIWPVPEYEMFLGIGPPEERRVGDLVLKSEVLPPQTGTETLGIDDVARNVTLPEGPTVAVDSSATSRRLRSRQLTVTNGTDEVVWKFTSELSSNFTAETSASNEGTDIEIKQRFTGQRMSAKAILYLTSEALRSLPFQKVATALISDDYQPGDIIEPAMMRSGDRLDITVLKVESEGKPIRWMEMASVVRQAINEPIIRNQWDSFTADAGWPKKEPFLRLRLFVGNGEGVQLTNETTVI